MSDAEKTTPSPRSPLPPLSWPPPGLEKLQGRLWKAIGLTWVGSIILVLPLLWELATEQPFWSLGPFEGNWQVGVSLAVLGMIIIVSGFWVLFRLLRDAAAASDAGYGTYTILEVASDIGRDTGFLIQGKRHFSSLDTDYRAAIAMARLRGAGLVLAAAVYLSVGFGLSVLLAARGFVTPSGIWLLTLGPTVVLLVLGLGYLFTANTRVHSAKQTWLAQAGGGRVQSEAAAWAGRLDEAGGAIALGAGPKGEAGKFRSGATVIIVLALATLIPTATVAVTATIGPILAEIAVPQFLSVQEMAGAAEVLRRYRVELDRDIPASRAGSALQNLAFVGTDGTPEPWERRPETVYAEGWFPNPDFFPDPFSETVAHDLIARSLSEFSDEERAALRQAADHPAQAEFEVLAHAPLVDVVNGRWVLPFPDTLTFQSLPWPRFAAMRTAGLARVARAAVQLGDRDQQGAESTLRDLISTGFLLIDQGPTLIDNLMGVVLANMGGDALEALYQRTGDEASERALRWSREGAAAAARRARAGLVAEDIRSLLQGIPDLVLDEDPLRGLRWEYFATFNMLAPCINVHKMVFGPDETYDEWRMEARDALVRVRGETELFELAEGAAFGPREASNLKGFLPHLLSLTLGSGGAPGSCASLINSLGSGESM
ncbi:MAG: hypothetical protein ACE5GJ_14105 [Gemmatimonadota bacterium]